MLSSYFYIYFDCGFASYQPCSRMPACLALGCTASLAEGSGDRREPVPGAGMLTC